MRRVWGPEEKEMPGPVTYLYEFRIYNSYSTDCQRFMAVTEPSLRVQPGDEVCLLSHKLLATRAITIT